ncbi:hypothetical protein BGZ63DRAFT_87928 [Mariannaea sp. PMI_226]|nr:hypothetical protein BGZ63DRAFT_87928 [Mariannaea sp. PMI_226]
MTGADAAPAFFTDLPLTSPQARRSVPTAVASNNPVADADKMETEEGEKEDEDEQYSFTRFLDHRQTGNDNDIEILVEWDQGSPTWEPETNLHHDAPDTLFAYWKSQGGRPLNPEDPDLFEIYAIRKHSKNKKRLQVEWLGYDKSEWTWLPSSVVEETAREVVEAYWRDQKGK